MNMTLHRGQDSTLVDVFDDAAALGCMLACRVRLSREESFNGIVVCGVCCLEIRGGYSYRCRLFLRACVMSEFCLRLFSFCLALLSVGLV